LLDEPTNHLDMRAKDVLLEALEEFSGTVVFVSHDRYFIDKLATRVFEIGEGEVRVFPGNYEDYVWRKSGAGAPVAEKPAAEAANGTVAVAPPAPKQTSPKPAVKQRLNPIKMRQMKDRRRAIEDEVTRLEVEIAEYERALAAYKSADESVRLAGLLEARRADLKSLLDEWEDVAQSIEAGG
jgi:ATP-binding cassette subfamily F protein 3